MEKCHNPTKKQPNKRKIISKNNEILSNKFRLK